MRIEVKDLMAARPEDVRRLARFLGVVCGDDFRKVVRTVYVRINRSQERRRYAWPRG